MELYFLLHDVTGERDPRRAAPTAPPVAELVSTRNVVRVQPAGSLIWEDATPGETLYRKQSVLTAEQAKAEIAFLDGTGIVLDQNSMIEIEKKPAEEGNGYSRLVLKLLRGTIYKSTPRKRSEFSRRTTPTTPAFDIQVGASTFHPTPETELSVSSTPESPGTATLLVRSGEVKVENGQDQATVKSGEEAQVRVGTAAGELVNSREMPFVLLGPSGGETIETDSDVQVKFRWNVTQANAGARAMLLEASTDPGFAQNVKTVRIPATEPPLKFVEATLRLAAPARAEQWYWRVKSHDDGVASSHVETFSIAPTLKPELTYPAARTLAKAGGDLELSWRPVVGATGYELELNGKAVSVNESSYHLSEMESGTLHWRVRARLGSGDTTNWSELRELKIESRQTPPPPELLEPEMERKAKPAAPSTEAPGTPAPKQTFLEWLIPSAHAEDDLEMPEDRSIKIHFRWKPVEGIHRYKVQVSRSRSFSRVIAEAEIDLPEWTWTYEPGMENSEGRAFYRVASVTDDGDVGEYSRPRALQLVDGFEADETRPTRKVETMQQLVEDKKIAAPLPTQTTAQNIAVVEASNVKRQYWMISPEIGVGNLSQKSGAADLTSVSMQSVFLHQQLRAVFDNEDRRWSASALLGLVSFRKPTEGATTDLQPDFTAATLQLDAFKWDQSGATADGERGLGLRLERSFRFAKSGPQSVEAQSAFSLGPAARLARTWNGGPGLREIGALAALPLTGVLTGGFIGIEGSFWTEWRLTGMGQGFLGFRPQADFSYQHWSSPDGTQVLAWAIWFAPTFHF